MVTETHAQSKNNFSETRADTKLIPSAPCPNTAHFDVQDILNNQPLTRASFGYLSQFISETKTLYSSLMLLASNCVANKDTVQYDSYKKHIDDALSRMEDIRHNFVYANKSINNNSVKALEQIEKDIANWQLENQSPAICNFITKNYSLGAQASVPTETSAISKELYPMLNALTIEYPRDVYMNSTSTIVQFTAHEISKDKNENEKDL